MTWFTAITVAGGSLAAILHATNGKPGWTVACATLALATAYLNV